MTGGSLSSFSTRSGGGVDWNFAEAIALRVDVSSLALSNGVTPNLGLVTDQWQSSMNVATTSMFRLGS